MSDGRYMTVAIFPAPQDLHAEYENGTRLCVACWALLKYFGEPHPQLVGMVPRNGGPEPAEGRGFVSYGFSAMRTCV